MLILKLIGSYLLTPVLWLGILYVIISYNQRINKERKQFRVAINKDFYEGRNFIKYGLFFFVIGSLISMILGLTLPTNSVYIYQILVVLAFLINGFSTTSMLLVMTAAGILELVVPRFITFFGDVFPEISGPSWLLLIFISILADYYLTRNMKKHPLSPRIKSGKRGRNIATYLGRETVVFPLLALIPSGTLSSTLNFWPVFNIGNQKFSLILFPIFISTSVKVIKRAKERVIQDKLKNIELLLGLTFVLIVLTKFMSKLFLISLIILTVVSIFFEIKLRKKEKDANSWYVETDEGIRIISVQPETPAAKMKLQPGDVILTCNNRVVNSEEEFYQALQLNSAYCHVKVRTYEGDLRIAESAIFMDSPHEIGLILFH
ncbi:PDZ domain-containing protein [Ligilactobacillus salivarius]|uniref:PDZ domain-containing protein n=1 Tax=Ligilactobacillus salivarius TaxID=1624 RepID=UPI0009DB5264|nr:PDZ domain-containing protein [Ligilactobacillus salivarius]MBM6955717.1 PDZ domain-containing protein [Ligilactobacillus salivarius]MDF4190661.1 PDZ domain-containing protein [Ligilactobacillus salivarius]OQQ87787.1 PDZ domain-containing protein [Ligilactobacillus salivarius]OQR10157.1 PDZ domain-containing protein [Ligilactobacillus salivarius]OUQ32242.1 PDZ domain-containing protein [Ligilactobacillus salivarius]